MAFKAVLLCASALLVQSISANCGNRYAVPSCGCSSSKDYVSISSSGGDFKVTSIGPISPSGIAVASDLSLDGTLDVAGTLPFLSAVSFQDNFDTKGSASASYSCGDGSVGITNVIGGGAGGIGLSSIGSCGYGNNGNVGISNVIGGGSNGISNIGVCGCRN